MVFEDQASRTLLMSAAFSLKRLESEVVKEKMVGGAKVRGRRCEVVESRKILQFTIYAFL